MITNIEFFYKIMGKAKVTRTEKMMFINSRETNEAYAPHRFPHCLEHLRKVRNSSIEASDLRRGSEGEDEQWQLP